MSNQLNEPIRLRHGATLKNRIVMAPMQTHSGKRGGYISDDTLQYYSARSQAGSMLITEFHYVSENGGPAYQPGYPEQLGAYTDGQIEGLTQIAKALKKDGNKAILQIHHAGRAAIGQAVSGEDVFAPSAIDFPFLNYSLRELTNEEILTIIHEFGHATKRAIIAGFDGVEIHGANHYLLQQFFSKVSNLRKDEWGGDVNKRMAFPLAVVNEVVNTVKKYGPKDFIIGYRISPEEIHGSTIGYTYLESTKLIAKIVNYELDYIHLSLWDGYNSTPKNSHQTYAELVKEVLDDQTKLVIVGGVFSEKSAVDAVENYADLIAVARGTLVEPQFAKKVLDGKGESIYHRISPENLNYVNWTQGLLEAYSREDFLGLPPIPGVDTIRSFHTGKFDMFYKK